MSTRSNPGTHLTRDPGPRGLNRDKAQGRRGAVPSWEIAVLTLLCLAYFMLRAVPLLVG